MKKVGLLVVVFLLLSTSASALTTIVQLQIEKVSCNGCTPLSPSPTSMSMSGVAVQNGIFISTDSNCATVTTGQTNGPDTLSEGGAISSGAATIQSGTPYFFCIKLDPFVEQYPISCGGSATLGCGSRLQQCTKYISLGGLKCGGQFATAPDLSKYSVNGQLLFKFPFIG